jgi:hypothetical protein
MPCHLCCLRKVDVIRIENWLLCADCRRSEILDQVLQHLRNGDRATAERIVSRDQPQLFRSATIVP